MADVRFGGSSREQSARLAELDARLVALGVDDAEDETADGFNPAGEVRGRVGVAGGVSGAAVLPDGSPVGSLEAPDAWGPSLPVTRAASVDAWVELARVDVGADGPGADDGVDDGDAGDGGVDDGGVDDDGDGFARHERFAVSGGFVLASSGSSRSSHSSGGVDADARRWSRSPSRVRARQRLPAACRVEQDEWVYPLPPWWRLDGSLRVRDRVSGALVADAAPVELSRLWSFPVVDAAVVVPLGFEQLPELAWVASAGDQGVWSRPPRRVSVWFVPLEQWRARSRSRVDVSSPQFDVRRVVDLAGFAELVGLSASTLRAYRSRGLLPEPVATVGVSPVWTRHQVAQWVLDGPSAGPTG